MTLLQAEAAVEKFTADSIQARTSETLAALKDTEPNVLLQNLGQQALHFGLKVLAALAIYIIGAWIIKKIVKIVAKGFEKKRSDAALASFVKSLVSITLWVVWCPPVCACELWCVCWFRFSACALSFLVCFCESWVPLVPWVKRHDCKTRWAVAFLKAASPPFKKRVL